MSKRHVNTAQNARNIWMYLFWTLLLLVITIFTLLSYFGVVHINTAENRIFTKQNYRRSTSPSFANENSLSSAEENKHFTKRDGQIVVVKDNEQNDETINDENVVMEGAPNKNKNTNNDDESEESEQRDTGNKKKKGILTETDLLEFHMKAVNKINTLNIEKNLE